MGVKKELLRVENITVASSLNKGTQMITGDISFSVREGEILGIVGESGSGKSMTALSILGLLPSGVCITRGRICYKGKNLLELSGEEKRAIKGKEISMIFQDPMTSLNPVMKIGLQVEEMLLLHTKLGRNERRERTIVMLREAGLKDPKGIYHKYPHQLSGGMRQRAMIAMAMSCNPDLLIADEPTTALDVIVQEKILTLIQRMNREHGTAVLLISHDIGVIKSICHRAIVMHQGNVMDEGIVEELFTNPKKIYTKKLLDALPGKEKRLKTEIKIQQEKVLQVRDLDVFYEERKKGLYGSKYKKQILKNISFDLHQGEILGLVGNSGSGKTTLAKALTSLLKHRQGSILPSDHRPQMVFQDPYSSLNPAKKVEWIMEEPLRIQGGYTKRERKKRVLEVLEQVGLEKKHLKRTVSKMSGGQRQRVGIACALMCKPKVIILDEPVSALDVTVQDKILKLLLSLREQYNISYLLISHDKAVLEQMCDRIMELKDGRLSCFEDMNMVK